MNGKSTAYKVVLAQLCATLVVAALLWAIIGTAGGIAAAVGGVIGVIANLIFVRYVFSAAAVPASVIVRRFYIAETMKIILTAVMFLGAFLVLQLSFVPLLLGYGATLLVYWAALLKPSAPVTT